MVIMFSRQELTKLECVADNFDLVDVLEAKLHFLSVLEIILPYSYVSIISRRDYWLCTDLSGLLTQGIWLFLFLGLQKITHMQTSV